MTPDQRIALLEQRLAQAEQRIAQLEAARMRTMPVGPLPTWPAPMPFDWLRVTCETTP